MSTRNEFVLPEAEYWSIYLDNRERTICSVHKTLAAAKRAARGCEKRSGAKIKHRIARVIWVA
jgi:hypothetical protein